MCYKQKNECIDKKTSYVINAAFNNHKNINNNRNDSNNNNNNNKNMGQNNNFTLEDRYEAMKEIQLRLMKNITKVKNRNAMKTLNDKNNRNNNNNHSNDNDDDSDNAGNPENIEYYCNDILKGAVSVLNSDQFGGFIVFFFVCFFSFCFVYLSLKTTKRQKNVCFVFVLCFVCDNRFASSIIKNNPSNM